MRKSRVAVPFLLLVASGAASGCAAAPAGGPVIARLTGSISGRVMVVTETRSWPYEGVAVVSCEGQESYTVRSEPGTGWYACPAARDQAYKVKASGAPYGPGATKTTASASDVIVELSPLSVSSADSLGGPRLAADSVMGSGRRMHAQLDLRRESAYERRVRTASPEQRQLLCEAARWAEHAEAVRIACDGRLDP